MPSDSAIVSILDQCIEAMAPERSKEKHGDGYYTYANGYKIGGGMSFDESPFLEALDACLEWHLAQRELELSGLRIRVLAAEVEFVNAMANELRRSMHRKRGKK